MNTDYIYLAHSLAALAGLPVRLYRSGHFAGLWHHAKFKPDPAIVEEENIFRNSGSVSYYIDENFLYYGLFRVAKDDVALLIGPVAQMPVDLSASARILRRMGEPSSRSKELATYFSSMPAYPLRTFLQILCTVNYFINDEKLDVVQLLTPEDTPLPVAVNRQEPEVTLHSTMDLENRMLSYIEHGQTAEIQKLFQSPAAGQAGPMATDTLRQQKNLLICTATLVTRAAIRGGLAPETAFGLSDMYIKKAELLTDVAALVFLNSQMVLDFTQRVEAEKCGIHQTPLIRKAREYVLSHIGQVITTEALAKELGMNRTYLCKSFLEETGMTVGNYITNLKIEEARRLIDITQKSAAEIAEYLGYSSQSHFQRVFKKVTGITPGQYRKGEKVTK